MLQEICVAPGVLVQCGDCISGWTQLLDIRQVIIQLTALWIYREGYKFRSGFGEKSRDLIAHNNILLQNSVLAKARR